MNRNQWIAIIVLALLVLVAIGIGVLMLIRKPVVTSPPNTVVPALMTGAKRQPVNRVKPLNAQTPTYREVTGLKST